MLVLTPAARKAMRRELRRLRTARERSIGADRREALVTASVVFIRAEWEADAIPTPFGHEGTLRAAIRAGLCLQGWVWVAADDAARDVVREALARLGAKRPTWQQGQPEPVERFVERTRCVICHDRLPEGHTRFCSTVCGSVADSRRDRERLEDEARARGAVGAA